MLTKSRKIQLSLVLFFYLIPQAYSTVQGQFYELSLNKSNFAVNEQIVVNYGDFGGYKQDWITIVPADAPVTSYKEWYYTNGRTSGSMAFKGLSAGTYEVRAYANWPIGKYHVRNSIRFTVGGQESFSGTALSGNWSTTYGDMHLTQVGDYAFGYYGPKSSGKIIEGKIVGNRFIGRWGRSNNPDNWGQVQFVLNDYNSSFEGSWRYGNSGSWRGWNGDRK